MASALLLLGDKTPAQETVLLIMALLFITSGPQGMARWPGGHCLEVKLASWAMSICFTWGHGPTHSVTLISMAYTILDSILP